jgi:hypothetical protein
MPDAAVYHWTPQGTPTAQPFAQDVHASFVYGVGVDDFLAWQLLGYQAKTNGDSAGQMIFLYASQAQARCQYLSAVAEAASSQAQSRSFQARLGLPLDAVTSETVSGADDSAWTESWTSANTDYTSAGPQTDVDYIVQVGTAVTFVSFVLPGLNQSVPNAAEAQAILGEITQHLSVYASGS